MGSGFSIVTNPEDCPDTDYFPTFREFLKALGGWGVGLVVATCLTTLLVIIQFIYLVIYSVKRVPATRRPQTLWVNSVFMVACFMGTLGVLMPKAADFIWLAYRVYVTLPIGAFVDLTLCWYGGEQALVDTIGDGNVVNFRIGPCCCCFACPKRSPLTRKKIKVSKS